MLLFFIIIELKWWLTTKTKINHIVHESVRDENDVFAKVLFAIASNPRKTKIHNNVCVCCVEQKVIRHATWWNISFLIFLTSHFPLTYFGENQMVMCAVQIFFFDKIKKIIKPYKRKFLKLYFIYHSPNYTCAHPSKLISQEIIIWVRKHLFLHKMHI